MQQRARHRHRCQMAFLWSRPGHQAPARRTRCLGCRTARRWVVLVEMILRCRVDGSCTRDLYSLVHKRDPYFGRLLVALARVPAKWRKHLGRKNRSKLRNAALSQWVSYLHSRRCGIVPHTLSPYTRLPDLERRRWPQPARIHLGAPSSLEVFKAVGYFSPTLPRTCASTRPSRLRRSCFRQRRCSCRVPARRSIFGSSSSVYWTASWPTTDNSWRCS